MTRSISFSDLKLATTLSKYREIDLLHPALDPLVSDVLEECGMDVLNPVIYIPSKHRNRQGKIVVGFVAVGEISLKRKYIKQGIFDTMDVIIAAAKTDPYLAREMLSLMGKSPGFLMSDVILEDELLPQDQLESDCLEIQAQLKQLEDIRDSIRGCPYNASGALKTYHEYAKGV